MKLILDEFAELCLTELCDRYTRLGDRTQPYDCGTTQYFPKIVEKFGVTQILAPYLSESRIILDLGTSNGSLAANIKKELAKTSLTPKFIGYDTHIQGVTMLILRIRASELLKK